MNNVPITTFFPLISAMAAMSVSQCIKLTIFMIKKDTNVSYDSLLTAGGMPSSHSALITSVSCAIGLTKGIHSTDFFLSLILALIVIYDARGIRHSVGRHATVLNTLVIPTGQPRLNERIGHTIPEVIGGIIIGLVTSFALHWALIR